MPRSPLRVATAFPSRRTCSTATAALISLGVWLFLALLWPAVSQILGEVISPSDIRFAQLGLPTPDTVAWQQGLARLSPGTLYGEAATTVVDKPSTRIALAN